MLHLGGCEFSHGLTYVGLSRVVDFNQLVIINDDFNIKKYRSIKHRYVKERLEAEDLLI